MEQEQLFLVAVPGDPVKSVAKQIRNRINDKFNIYGNFKPALHTTVEVIKPKHMGDLEKAKEIINNISRQFSPFSLNVSGFVFFSAPHKAITLAIEKNNEIEILSSLIYEALAECGMIGREHFQSWKFHMTLASPFGAIREWNEEEYTQACNLVQNMKVEAKCTIQKLELWRPVFDPIKMREDVFCLKS